MEYITKSGYKLTEETIEKWAEAAERGEYPGAPGKVIVAPQGRPKLCDEELVTVAFKIPLSVRNQLDAKARTKNESRSQFLRNALDAALT